MRAAKLALAVLALYPLMTGFAIIAERLSVVDIIWFWLVIAAGAVFSLRNSR